MRPSSRLTASLLSASALLLVVSMPAHAQFGKLKKMGADAIKDATKGKLGDKDTTSTSKPGAASSAAASGNTKAPTRAPNYTITAERIDLVVASLQPLVADAEKLAIAAKAAADYKTKRDAAQACFDRAQKMVNPMSLATPNPGRDAKLEKMNKQLEAVGERSNAAMARDDLRAGLALRDTSEVLQMMVVATTFNMSCVFPYMPAAVLDGQVAAAKRGNADDASEESQSLDPAPAAKEAMMRNEFGMVRERIALWLMAQDNPSLQKGSEGKFTADENAAMSAKAPALKKLAPLFASNSLRWSTWGDVKRW